MADVQTTVPPEVRDVLAEVRATGTVNMLDRQGVLRCISDLHTATSARAYLWLVGAEDVGSDDRAVLRVRATPAQRSRYLAALASLGREQR
jgi:hypothetical protein